MAEERCECEVQSMLVFPCSGSSNVGQIANAVGVELTRLGRARMYCLAGMGAHIPGMVDSAQHADLRIAIDGCAVACARKTLEQAGLHVDRAVIITELGIAKNHEFEWTYDELDRVMEAALAGLPQLAGAESCGCACSE